MKKLVLTVVIATGLASTVQAGEWDGIKPVTLENMGYLSGVYVTCVDEGYKFSRSARKVIGEILVKDISQAPADFTKGMQGFASISAEHGKMIACAAAAATFPEMFD